MRQKCNGFLPYVGPHFLGFEVIWFFIIIALSRLIATFLFCLIFYYNENRLHYVEDIFYYTFKRQISLRIPPEKTQRTVPKGLLGQNLLKMAYAQNIEVLTHQN